MASVVAAVNNAASNYTQSGYSAIPTSSYNISGQSDNHGMNISVLNSRPTNLITIHAQEPAAAASNQAAYSSYTTGILAELNIEFIFLINFRYIFELSS